MVFPFVFNSRDVTAADGERQCVHSLCTAAQSSRTYLKPAGVLRNNLRVQQLPDLLHVVLEEAVGGAASARLLCPTSAAAQQHTVQIIGTEFNHCKLIC